MPTLIQQAAAKGWTVKAGTLQAKGLWHAFKEPIRTDDDITVWCGSANDAAREALRMQAEQDKGYIIIDARYAKGKKVIQPLDGKGGFKGRVSYLAEALGGNWVHRSKGYTVSPQTAEKFLKLFNAGFEANVRCFSDSPATFYHEERKLENLKLKDALAKA